MMGAAILVGEISIGIDRLVIINLGLTAISIFGLVMAIFIGVGLVYKEMEKRTLYSLLAKPAPPMGISGREISGGLAADAGRKHIVHDARPGGSAFLREPPVPSQRCDDSHRHLFHPARTGARDRLRSLLLMLFEPHAFHAVHAGDLCGRVFLRRHSRNRHGHAKPGHASHGPCHQLLAA